MKKFILSLLVSVVSLMGFAQNGGQASENNSVKIEFVALKPNGQVVVKVTNKQNCTASIRVKGVEQVIKLVPALQSDTFTVTVPGNKIIRAKTETDCGVVDFGQVELDVQGYLPIHFEYIKATRLDANTIEVEFRANETESQKQYNIQISFDGVTYKTVTIVFPDTLEPHRIYKVKITLK